MLQISSPSFEHEGEIPSRHTCEGQDTSPPLRWSGAPDGTRSFVLIVDDPDAPDPRSPKMTWVHWVVYGIPSHVNAMSEDAKKAFPPGVHEGRNDWRTPGWRGPAPPVGRHRYFFKLYALDIELHDMGPQVDKSKVERAMKGHVLAQAVIVGTYKKMH